MTLRRTEIDIAEQSFVLVRNHATSPIEISFHETSPRVMTAVNYKVLKLLINFETQSLRFQILFLVLEMPYPLKVGKRKQGRTSTASQSLDIFIYVMTFDPASLKFYHCNYLTN
jgi:hypothetical protein